jgi:hypothetical protein
MGQYRAEGIDVDRRFVDLNESNGLARTSPISIHELERFHFSACCYNVSIPASATADIC